MPNTGRPSRDCHACRKRRVKCDLLRPHCNRCLRRGHSCPGYRDELSVRFRSENVSSFPAVMSRDNRKRRISEAESSTALVEGQKVQESTSEEEENNKDDTPANLKDVVLSFVTLRRSMENPRSTHLIPLVLSKIARDVTSGNADSLFVTIPRIVTQADSRSPIYKVCNAIGLAYVTSKSGGPIADAVKARGYRNALASVNAALQDSRRQTYDATLLAVWLFGVYEFLTNIPVVYPDEAYRNEIYCRGLMQLVRMRGCGQFIRPDGRNIVWYVCCSVQFKSLMAGLESPVEVLSWISSIHENGTPSERARTRASIFVNHCTRLSSRIQVLLQTNNPSLLLSNSSLIIQDIESLETTTDPFDNDPSITDLQVPPPLASPPTLNPKQMSLQTRALNIYMTNFRMCIALVMLTFLKEAACAPGCTPHQQAQFMRRQDRCVWEFRSLAERVLGMLALTHSELMGGGDDQGAALGWLEAVMMYGSLRTVAASHVSSGAQKDGARKSLKMFKEHLGMACPV